MDRTAPSWFSALKLGPNRRMRRELRSACSAWRAMVYKFADKNARISKRETEKYSQIHGRLMKVCKQIAESDLPHQSTAETTQIEHQTQLEPGAMQAMNPRTTDAESQILHALEKSHGHQMYALLKPWGNPKVIQNASPSIIEDLLRQQQAIEESVLNRRSRQGTFWTQSMIFIALIGVTFGCLLVILSDSIDTSFFHWMRSIMDSAATNVTQATFTEKLMFSCIAAWLIGTAVLWNASKG